MARANKPSAGVSPVDLSIKPPICSAKIDLLSIVDRLFLMSSCGKGGGESNKAKCWSVTLSLEHRAPFCADKVKLLREKKDLEAYLTVHIQEP